MIDTNELRRDASAAHVGHMPMELSGSEIIELINRLEAAESDALEQARLNGIGASREAALMAKLEAAEKDIALKERVIDSLGTVLNAVAKERDALRARIAEMEQQEPVGTLHDDGCFVWSTPRPYESNYAGWKMKLYLAPGAQPAPIEQDTSVRKAWARFSNELHRSHDAPYPGMSEAFEQHFSQSFTDREWRAESSTWAAAWKAAKRHGAQPAPSVPEGWKLVPTAESGHPGIYKMLGALHAVDNTPGASEWESYAAFLAAAPEAKP